LSKENLFSLHPPYCKDGTLCFSFTRPPSCIPLSTFPFSVVRRVFFSVCQLVISPKPFAPRGFLSSSFQLFKDLSVFLKFSRCNPSPPTFSVSHPFPKRPSLPSSFHLSQPKSYLLFSSLPLVAAIDLPVLIALCSGGFFFAPLASSFHFLSFPPLIPQIPHPRFFFLLGTNLFVRLALKPNSHLIPSFRRVLSVVTTQFVQGPLGHFARSRSQKSPSSSFLCLWRWLSISSFLVSFLWDSLSPDPQQGSVSLPQREFLTATLCYPS